MLAFSPRLKARALRPSPLPSRVSPGRSPACPCRLRCASSGPKSVRSAPRPGGSGIGASLCSARPDRCPSDWAVRLERSLHPGSSVPWRTRHPNSVRGRSRCFSSPLPGLVGALCGLRFSRTESRSSQSCHWTRSADISEPLAASRRCNKSLCG